MDCTLTLRVIRKDKGISQTWMAQQLGIARRTYLNYESGKRPIPKAVLFYAAHLLNVSPQTLQHEAH
jgi:transcriptional regulator with XRE-family HTH domain